MENLNDIKAIWHSCDTDDLPNPNEMIGIIKKYRYTKLVKSIVLVLFFLMFTGLFVWVVSIYRSALLSTRVGEGCIIIAGLILVITNITTVNRFYKYKDLSNKEFIAFLEHTRIRQRFYHTKTQVVTSILFTAGEFLYLFEVVYKNALVAIIVYSCTTVFFLVI